MGGGPVFFSTLAEIDTGTGFSVRQASPGYNLAKPDTLPVAIWIDHPLYADISSSEHHVPSDLAAQLSQPSLTGVLTPNDPGYPKTPALS
jgi:hypothetical protein